MNRCSSGTAGGCASTPKWSKVRVGSLCEALREITRFDEAGHWFQTRCSTYQTPDIEVQSAYTHPALSVRVKTPAPLFDRLAPLVQPRCRPSHRHSRQAAPHQRVPSSCTTASFHRPIDLPVRLLRAVFSDRLPPPNPRHPRPPPRRRSIAMETPWRRLHLLRLAVTGRARTPSFPRRLANPSPPRCAFRILEAVQCRHSLSSIGT